MYNKTTVALASLLIGIPVGVFVIAPLSSTHSEHVENDASPSITTTPKPEEVITANETAELPVFTKESLARYDGTDASLPIYLAFEGNVYDVTEGKRFYEPGGAYDFLAGTDGTTMLRIAGGGIIKKKYPVVGTYVE